MTADHVWYAAYGSNMHAARLRYYLAGGRPPGALREYPGCRDPSAPADVRPAILPGGVYFALESRAWTGGMAFYDPDLPGRAAARAYLITLAQFSDIAAQEMYTATGRDLDLDDVLANGRSRLGPGRYETLVHAGALDGHPVLTFTAPWRATEVDCTPPAPAYLGMLASGLREAHGWTGAEIAEYLGDLPGVRGNWSAADLADLTERRTP